MGEEEGIKSKIENAMLARVQHFKEQADSLTFEGVRRLLEKDLGFDTRALDVHKKLVKQLLEKCLEGNNDENASKNSVEELEENAGSTKLKIDQSPVKQEKKKEASNEDEDKMEDSPVMGLLTPDESTKSKRIENLASKKKNEVPSEAKIKEAMWKRAAYFKANSEKITMAGVRRLLEEDLDLDTKTLDPMKKYINKQLDEVLSSESPSVVKKKSSLNPKTQKSSKKPNTGESSASSASESEEIEERVKSKKKVVQKGKVEKSDKQKKRKAPVRETKVSNKKQKGHTKTKAEENSEKDDSGNASEDSKSESSAEKPLKRKEVASKKEVTPTPAYGKQVEHLKSIIKSCGMTVPPVVYKKAKQVPEGKRDSFLRKELEDILSKEGLSTNPSEKEIKEVKKKKERAKELEGIDMSNIVFSSRRRSTSSFVPPPRPKITVEESDDDSEESESDDDDDSSDDVDDNADENDNDGDEIEADDNQSVEAKEGEAGEEKGEEAKEGEADDNQSEDNDGDEVEADDNQSEEAKEGDAGEEKGEEAKEGEADDNQSEEAKEGNVGVEKGGEAKEDAEEND